MAFPLHCPVNLVFFRTNFPIPSKPPFYRLFTIQVEIDNPIFVISSGHKKGLFMDTTSVQIPKKMLPNKGVLIQSHSKSCHQFLSLTNSCHHLSCFPPQISCYSPFPVIISLTGSGNDNLIIPHWSSFISTAPQLGSFFHNYFFHHHSILPPLSSQHLNYHKLTT
jgi:hypothetical protein